MCGWWCGRLESWDYLNHLIDNMATTSKCEPKNYVTVVVNNGHAMCHAGREGAMFLSACYNSYTCMHYAILLTD
jgi:hypothetical protein